MSEATLGNAARHILQGTFDPARLAEMRARCSRCQWIERTAPSRGPLLGGFPQPYHGCWHLDAERLLANGLRSGYEPPVTLL